MSKFSRAKSEEIVAAMRAGAGLGEAAEIAHITRQTVWNWRKEGRLAGRGLKYDFDLQVGAIEAGDIATAARTVKNAMRQQDDLKTAVNAAQWFLERKRPDEYGRHDKLTIDHANLAQQLLDYLRDRLDSETYNRVLVALAPESSDGPTVLQLA